MDKIDLSICSYSGLQSAVDDLANFWVEHKNIRLTVSNLRTLSQNALKSVWYKDISLYLGDRSAKSVERECKLAYGVPILRRDPVNNWVYERSLDQLPYSDQLIAIDSFAITSEMSNAEIKEYLDTMHEQYPFLECKKRKKR